MLLSGDGFTKPRLPNPIDFLFEVDVKLKNTAKKSGQSPFMFQFNLRMDQHFLCAFVEGLQKKLFIKPSPPRCYIHLLPCDFTCCWSVYSIRGCIRKSIKNQQGPAPEHYPHRLIKRKNMNPLRPSGHIY